MKNLNQKGKVAAVATSLIVVAGSASAAVSTEAQGVLDSVLATVTDTATAVWPVVAAFLIAKIGIRLIKSFVNKAV
ncbi:MAG: phage coat protein [Zhongshania sp.]|uniref:major coat protein n=1 Tax=Zhongshania sp. TaxID=1971902 RepID=UPI00260CE13F|nr:major coat protein [Zhongshania sp.]MDF1694102.1 phage coat protein [Zhongshania sp.]